MTGAEYLEAVRSLPCAVCLAPPPSSAHHCIMGRFSQRRSSDFDAIPLCAAHHQNGGEGAIALHREPALWRDWYGADTDHIAPTRRAILGETADRWCVVGGDILFMDHEIGDRR